MAINISSMELPVRPEESSFDHVENRQQHIIQQAAELKQTDPVHPLRPAPSILDRQLPGEALICFKLSRLKSRL